MAMEMLDSSGNVLRITITGELKLVQYDAATAVAEAEIERLGSVNVLLILKDFEGWEHGADWGDITFMLERGKDIEKMAIVGDEKWKDLVFAFAGKPFRTAAIEYFDPSQIDAAEAWLEGESQ